MRECARALFVFRCAPHGVRLCLYSGVFVSICVYPYIFPCKRVYLRARDKTQTQQLRGVSICLFEPSRREANFLTIQNGTRGRLLRSFFFEEFCGITFSEDLFGKYSKQLKV